MFSEARDSRTRRKPIWTLKKHVKLHTESNPNLVLNQWPWSCEEAVLPDGTNLKQNTYLTYFQWWYERVVFKEFTFLKNATVNIYGEKGFFALIYLYIFFLKHILIQMVVLPPPHIFLLHLFSTKVKEAFSTCTPFSTRQFSCSQTCPEESTLHIRFLFCFFVFCHRFHWITAGLIVAGFVCIPCFFHSDEILYNNMLSIYFDRAIYSWKLLFYTPIYRHYL